MAEGEVGREGSGCGGGGGGVSGGGQGISYVDVIRVLVVDDSPVDRMIVQRLLDRSGMKFEVVTADSGEKALEVLGLKEQDDELLAVHDKKMDIVLTDYCMPGMNGHELLKAVKARSCSTSIPVVLMSSDNDPQRISSCLASGAEDFLLKPLKAVDIQRLWSYASPPIIPAPKAGTKRKLPLDSLTENTESERRPRLAGVAVA